MAETRRVLVLKLLGLLGTCAAAAGQRMPTASPLPSPNAPDPHAPAGLEQPPIGREGSKGLSSQNQKQVHDEVEKLYQLALELKQQVESTDLNSVLSLGIVKRAQQIEKLAKQVREHAKG